MTSHLRHRTFSLSALVALALLIALMLATCAPAPARADPPGPPDGLVIETIVPVCETEDLITQVWAAHSDGGEEMGIHVFLRLHPKCQLLDDSFEVVRTISRAWLSFKDRPYWSALVVLLDADGAVRYGILTNAVPRLENTE